jgi:hypothetical protein
MTHEDFADDDDRMESRRRWNALIDDVDAEIREERAAQMFETDIGAVLDTPSPLVVDVGVNTSRRDREAIQAEQDRWTRWERMGR